MMCYLAFPQISPLVRTKPLSEEGIETMDFGSFIFWLPVKIICFL